MLTFRDFFSKKFSQHLKENEELEEEIPDFQTEMADFFFETILYTFKESHPAFKDSEEEIMVIFKRLRNDLLEEMKPIFNAILHLKLNFQTQVENMLEELLSVFKVQYSGVSSDSLNENAAVNFMTLQKALILLEDERTTKQIRDLEK